jgi:hypothetical protein
LVLAGCGASDRIIGRWQDVDGVQYKFYKDGTITIDSFCLKFTGDYEFIDTDTIRIDMGGLLGLAGPTVMRVEFTGDQLILSDGGAEIILEKVD